MDELDADRLQWVVSDLAHFCNEEYQQFLEQVTDASRAPSVAASDPGQQNVWPQGAISWDSALNHLGIEQYVCGPLASIRYSSDDAFLNLGEDYPSPTRFTVVLWDVGEIEQIPSGTTICIMGPITTYEGSAQIQTWSLEQVEVWE